MSKEFLDNLFRMVMVPSICFMVSRLMTWGYAHHAPETWPDQSYVTAVCFPLLLFLSVFVVTCLQGWRRQWLDPVPPVHAVQKQSPLEHRLPPIQEVDISHTELMAGKPALYTGSDGKQEMKLVPVRPPIPPAVSGNEMTVVAVDIKALLSEASAWDMRDTDLQEEPTHERTTTEPFREEFRARIGRSSDESNNT